MKQESNGDTLRVSRTGGIERGKRKMHFRDETSPRIRRGPAKY